ncbi:MAG: putative LPS assembly protein LptD [Candidatus Cloacimonadota bacterium]|nr:putative LPS assembly protein LptD [Candidatus Cloacimonadota bacterium]
MAAIQIDSILVDSTRADSTEVIVDSIRYTAKKIINNYQDEQIKLINDASIFYQNTYLKSDSIVIDVKDKIAVSYGLSEMFDGNNKIFGSKVYFDLDTKEGILKNGRTRFHDGYYSGENMRKVGEEVFDIDNGKFTTCNIGKHYYIYSPKFRIFLNDKIVGKPIILFINHFPVLALPFATFPIKRTRESGFLIPEPGYNSTDGKYLKNFAYFQIFRDYGDFMLSADINELTGLDFNLRGRYIKRYILNGNVNSRLFYFHEEANDSYQIRWSFNSFHKQKLSPYSDLTIKTDFVSDTDILQINEDKEVRMEKSLHSYVFYNFSKDRINFNAASDYKRDLDDDTETYYNKIYYSTRTDYSKFNLNGNFKTTLYPNQKNRTTLALPSLSYNIYRHSFAEIFKPNFQREAYNELLKNSNISYSGKLANSGAVIGNDPTFAEIFYKDTYDSTGAYLSEHREGIKHSVTVSYIDDIFKYFRFDQSLSYDEIWEDKDKNNDKFVRGFSYSSNTKLSTKIYGLFYFENSRLIALRHIISPNISYSMHPDFSENDKFYSFSGISISSADRSEKVSFSLTNQLQAKVKGEEHQIKNLNNLLKISSSLSYDFEEKPKGFSNISHTATLIPFNFSFLGISANYSNSFRCTQDSYDFDITKYFLSASLSLKGKLPYIDYYPYDPPKSLGELIDSEDKSFISPNPKLSEKPWSLSFSYSYSKDKNSNIYSSDIHAKLTLNLTNKWSIDYSNYYNFKKHELISQSIHLHRDLHCWALDLSWNKSGDYWSYKFKVVAVKLPDLKFRHSDHRH